MMTLHFDYLGSFNEDWQCTECKLDYPRRGEPSKAWRTYDGISQTLVCKDCISLQLDKALQHDGCFPACFHGVKLDPRQFKSLLSQQYPDEYSARYASISAQRANAQAHFPELLTCGVDYQICPGCKSAACLEDEKGCKQVNCICCLTSVYFRCGLEADGDSPLDVEGH
jgi:hypothetical protein